VYLAQVWRRRGRGFGGPVLRGAAGVAVAFDAAVGDEGYGWGVGFGEGVGCAEVGGVDVGWCCHYC